MATSLAQQPPSMVQPKPQQQGSRERAPSDATGGNRRRPFSTWMKKLGFKHGSSSTSAGNRGRNQPRRILNQMTAQDKRGASQNNNPYPLSGRLATASRRSSQPSMLTRSATGHSIATSSSIVDMTTTTQQLADSDDPSEANQPVAADTRATSTSEPDGGATTMSPQPGGASTIGTRTVGGVSRRGGDSTFSSPAPSIKSLATTLTTMQSGAHQLHPALGGGNTSHGSPTTHMAMQHFTQPFPSASLSPGAASATSSMAAATHHAHHGLAGGLSSPISIGAMQQPTTYTRATANNLLTDDASILTLASSSRTRRRRSLDTDASVRALAPSSLWGGSRESLPLSILSANMDGPTGSSAALGGAAGGGGGGGSATPTGTGMMFAGRLVERSSIYSASGGVTPALASDRTSFYTKQSFASAAACVGDSGSVRSVRSGMHGHARADSTGMAVGVVSSPLAAPPSYAGAAAASEVTIGSAPRSDEISETAVTQTS